MIADRFLDISDRACFREDPASLKNLDLLRVFSVLPMMAILFPSSIGFLRRLLSRIVVVFLHVHGRHKIKRILEILRPVVGLMGIAQTERK